MERVVQLSASCSAVQVWVMRSLIVSISTSAAIDALVLYKRAIATNMLGCAVMCGESTHRLHVLDVGLDARHAPFQFGNLSVQCINAADDPTCKLVMKFLSHRLCQ